MKSSNVFKLLVCSETDEHLLLRIAKDYDFCPLTLRGERVLVCKILQCASSDIIFKPGISLALHLLQRQ